uniref:Uncharacterized protein n=1 Tax=Anguilla anguilla TaxID=7936 RepID=A0A0E9TW87_ANGAN
MRNPNLPSTCSVVFVYLQRSKLKISSLYYVTVALIIWTL